MARILVVDDQPHVSRTIANWLTRAGHAVVRASDGAAALELLRAESFDILITDVDMPELDGLSLLRQSDVIGRLRGVVVVTGRHDHGTLAATHGRGSIHVMPKPFSPSRLAELVEQLLSG